jgi:uncharacterized protein (DUF1015 family)
VEPYTDVTNEDGVQHTLWRLPEEHADGIEDAFSKIGALYVADGHHRSAAAFNVGMQRRNEAIRKGLAVTDNEPFNYFMSICYPSDNLLIMDYNRVIKDLNGMTPAQFMLRLQGIFNVEKLGGKASPREKGCFTMLLNDQWYKLRPIIRTIGIDS